MYLIKGKHDYFYVRGEKEDAFYSPSKEDAMLFSSLKDAENKCSDLNSSFNDRDYNKVEES